MIVIGVPITTGTPLILVIVEPEGTESLINGLYVIGVSSGVACLSSTALAPIAFAGSEVVISANVTPSVRGIGVAVIVPMLVCWTPAGGAVSVAVQVIETPALREVAGQIIEEAGILSSVTTTGLRSMLPVLVTR